MATRSTSTNYLRGCGQRGAGRSKSLVGTNPQINKITGNPQCQMKSEINIHPNVPILSGALAEKWSG